MARLKTFIDLPDLVGALALLCSVDALRRKLSRGYRLRVPEALTAGARAHRISLRTETGPHAQAEDQLVCATMNPHENGERR